jgi:hypothetical protein
MGSTNKLEESEKPLFFYFPSKSRAKQTVDVSGESFHMVRCAYVNSES